MKLTLEQLRNSKAGQRADNQALLAEVGRRPRAVGAVEAKKPEPDQRREAQDRELGSVQEGVAYRISLIVFSRKKMDAHDNLRSAAKPIVDRITEDLGFGSDNDPRLTWEYHQITGPGKVGVIVKIETIYDN